MKKAISIAAICTIGVALFTQPGFGQSGGTGAPSLRRSTRPTTSPYLNLLDNRRGGVGFEYFRSVRPEMEFRSQNNRFRRSLDRVERQVNDQQRQLRQSGISRLTPSGHSTSFFNYGGYYTLPGQNR